MSSFPQLRKDPIVDRWVFIAPDRAARPGALLSGANEVPDDAATCPFCEGREPRTPAELFAWREPDSKPDKPGWKVRVVPNRYPAVVGTLGTHELIVECPQHEPSLAKLSVEQIAAVLRVIRSRMAARRTENQWSYGQWFKNHGLSAGASLAHSHSQLICLPDPPMAVQNEIESASIGRCIFCQLIDRELAEEVRLIFANDDIVTFTALAGRFPFETWLLPRKHGRHFEEVSDQLIFELAKSLRSLLRRMDVVAGQPGYNLILHNGPWISADFHWHFELLPRVTGVAGFEIGAGMFVNPIVPEDAAAQLRAESKLEI